ncbi:DUF3421 domain-containing protein [Oligoflexus tunisiensis]|uniref:DUF3421 domain-containing protein n=1 Tax=Oligoflexus tunisiensis TaxID=708132 RepID=UPI00114CF48F|nr:DUF3421 domain-containing protein [Oligoflexus tunisiensis]
MLKHLCYYMAIVVAGAACSRATINKAPLLNGQGFDQAIPNTEAEQLETPVPQETATQPVPMVMETDAAEEGVNPPNNISGSYLVCSETKAPTDTNPESQTNCALRDQTSNNKIDLASFASYSWSYQAPEASSLTVTMSELPLNPEWHVVISLKAPTLAEVRDQRMNVKFFLTVQDSAGVKHQESAGVSASVLQWLALDGARVPGTAILSGIDYDGTTSLYLCRVYTNNEVIPGKLINHYADPSRSMCLTTSNGANIILSQSMDARTMLRKSDVLVINQGSFDDYFEWVAGSGGSISARAVTSGTDVNGKPQYTCRGQRGNGPPGDLVPGVIRTGATVCAHLYYDDGVEVTPSYQVLSWKADAARKIMDSRSIPPP